MQSCKRDFTHTTLIVRTVIIVFVALLFWSNASHAWNNQVQVDLFDANSNQNSGTSAAGRPDRAIAGLSEANAARSRMIDQTIFEQVLAAALAGDEDRLKAFADANQLNALDNQGLSAALHTVKLDRLDATQLLINAGADVDAFDPEQTAFLYAGATGNNAAIRMLLKAGAKTNIYNYYGGTALIPAAEKGFVATVKLLLEESSTNVNHVNNLGWTALMEAVVLSEGGPNHQQIVRLLLTHGADPDIADREGVTALQHAQSKGFDEIAQILNTHKQ